MIFPCTKTRLLEISHHIDYEYINPISKLKYNIFTMNNRHKKLKQTSEKEKPTSRKNLTDRSPSDNLLELLISISTRHKSPAAEKAIRQSIADLIIDNIVFCHDFEDRLDEDYRPIKVQLIFESLRYRNIIINELIKFYQRNKNLNPQTKPRFKNQPQVIAINPIQPISISINDRDIIFNFKNAKIQWLKEVYQASNNEFDQEVYNQTTDHMLLVEHLLSSEAKNQKRVDFDDLLLARGKYEVQRHTKLHRVDVTQIGKISEILNRSFCEELEKSYQDYQKEEQQQNN